MQLIGWIITNKSFGNTKGGVYWEDGEYIAVWQNTKVNFKSVFDLKKWAKDNSLLYRERK